MARTPRDYSWREVCPFCGYRAAAIIPDKDGWSCACGKEWSGFERMIMDTTWCNYTSIPPDWQRGRATSWGTSTDGTLGFWWRFKPPTFLSEGYGLQE